MRSVWSISSLDHGYVFHFAITSWILCKKFGCLKHLLFNSNKHFWYYILSIPIFFHCTLSSFYLYNQSVWWVLIYWYFSRKKHVKSRTRWACGLTNHNTFITHQILVAPVPVQKQVYKNLSFLCLYYSRYIMTRH